MVPFEQLNMAHFAQRAAHAGPAPRPDRTRGSASPRPTSASRSEDALAEAARCFNCGVCNSCELCLIFCPDVAITRAAERRLLARPTSTARAAASASRSARAAP